MAVVPSGYRVVEADAAAFAVPAEWFVAPEDLPEVASVIAVAAGDYADGVPHFVQLRRYEHAPSIEALRTRLADDAPGGESVSDDAESVSVSGAQEAVRLSGTHRAKMGPSVDGPPLYWVSDHLLAVTAEDTGFTLTVSTARQRDDPELRTRILQTFHIE